MLHLQIAFEAGCDILPRISRFPQVIRAEIVTVHSPPLEFQVVYARFAVVHGTLHFESPDQHVFEPL